MNTDARAFALVASILRAWPNDRAGASDLLDSVDDWTAFTAAADRGLALPDVAAAIGALDLEDRVPPDHRALFAFVREANGRRNQELRAALLEVGRALNEAGIEPLLLKGANRLIDGLYPDLGWRMMTDLDLLLPPCVDTAALGTLAGLGYAPVGQRPTEHQHLPELVHAESGVMVELHREVMPARLRRLVTGAQVYGRASIVTIEGVRLRTPEPADQLLHVIAHDQLSHSGLLAGRVSLRALLEARLLMARLSTSEIGGVAIRLAEAGHARAGRVFITAMARTVDLPSSIPATVKPTALDRLLVRRALWHDRAPRAARVALGAATLLHRTARLREPRHAARVVRGLADPAFRGRRMTELRATLALLNPFRRLPPSGPR